MFSGNDAKFHLFQSISILQKNIRNKCHVKNELIFLERAFHFSFFIFQGNGLLFIFNPKIVPNLAQFSKKSL